MLKSWQMDDLACKRPWLHALAACVLFAAACSHHVQLQFLAQNAGAESYQCSKMTETKPETTKPNCQQRTVIDPTLENQARTTHVVIPDCETVGNKYYRITVLNADSSSPTVLVTCAQGAGHVH
jgi:hypothetical protein